MLKLYIQENKCHSLINKIYIFSLSDVYKMCVFESDYI